MGQKRHFTVPFSYLIFIELCLVKIKPCFNATKPCFNKLLLDFNFFKQRLNFAKAGVVQIISAIHCVLKGFDSFCSIKQIFPALICRAESAKRLRVCLVRLKKNSTFAI